MFGKGIGAPEIILILVVLVLLFGAKRLPDAARSLGRSMRIFKTEVKEMHKDDEERAGAERPREVEGRVVDPANTETAKREAAQEQADRDR